MDQDDANVPMGASMISALLADVDGALVTKAKVLTKRAIEAGRRLHENGIAFFITSRRPPRGMRMLVESLGLKMPMAPFNGGMIVHLDLSVVDERPLADDVGGEVINTLLAHGFDVWIYRGTEWCIRSAQAPHVDRETATVQFPPGFANGVERFVLTRAALLQNKSKRAGERTNEYESHTTAP